MSNKCQNCGAVIESQYGISDEWRCGSYGFDGVVCHQSDKCRIRELEKELEASEEVIRKLADCNGKRIAELEQENEWLWAEVERRKGRPVGYDPIAHE